MNMYITGTTIRELRERKHMTQLQLAEGGYDTTKEQKELEDTAKMLFG